MKTLLRPVVTILSSILIACVCLAQSQPAASKHEPDSGVVDDSDAAKDIAKVVLSHLLTKEKRDHLQYLDANLKAGVWTVRYGYPALAVTFPIVIQIRQQSGAIIKYENPNA